MDRFNAVLVADDAVDNNQPETTTRQGNPSSFLFPETPTSVKSTQQQQQPSKRFSISVSSAIAAASGGGVGTPTAISLASNGLPSKPNQAKFDQMMEAQMISDILRANTSLRQFKAFRVANEKLYKDKHLSDIRQKEIKEPLESALMEIEILNGKLSRREEMIAILRKQIYNEIIHSTKASNTTTIGTDDLRLQHLHDLHSSDELKTEELMDKIEAFKPVLQSQQQQITKLKQLVASQAEKIRHMFDEVEKMEIYQADQKKIFQTEKETFETMLEARENKIEMLLDERGDLQSRLRSAEKELAERRLEAKQLAVEKSDIAEKLKVAEEANLNLQQQLDIQKLQYEQLSEEQTISLERNMDLQARYDGLVTELDQMVEEGYYIPPEQDLTALINASSKKSKKKGSNNKASNSKSRRSSVVGSVVSGKTSSSKTKAGGSRIGNKSGGGASVMSASTMSSHENLEDDYQAGLYDDELLDEELIEKGTGEGLAGDTPSGKHSRRQSSQQGGRFAQRKMQEDALISERLQTSAALRQKEALVNKVTSLEMNLKLQKSQFEEEKRQAQITQDGLSLGQRILTTEISKLTNKLSTLEQENMELKDEVQVYKTTNNILQTQINTMPLVPTAGSPASRKGMSMFQRISMMLMAPAAEEDQGMENTVDQFVDRLVTPQLSPDRKEQRKHKRKQFFDEIKGVMHLSRPISEQDEAANKAEEEDVSEKIYTKEEWEARNRRLGRWKLRRREHRRKLWEEQQIVKKEEAFWQGVEFVPDEDYTSEDEYEDDDDQYDSEQDSGYNSEEERAQQSQLREQEEEMQRKKNEEEAEQQRVDMLHYMFAWENVHRNTITTQCGPGYDPEEVAVTKAKEISIQLDEHDFYGYLDAHGYIDHDHEEEHEDLHEEHGHGRDEDRETDRAEGDYDENEDDENHENDEIDHNRIDEEGQEENQDSEAKDDSEGDAGVSKNPSSSRKTSSANVSRKASATSVKSPKRSSGNSFRLQAPIIPRRDTGRPASSPYLNDSDADGSHSPNHSLSPPSPFLKNVRHGHHMSSALGGGQRMMVSTGGTQAEQDAYVKFKQVYGQQVMDLYQGLVSIVQHHFPKQKLSIFQLDPSRPEAWQSQLVAQDLLVGLDIEWQVKHALLFITACNELRNQFVGSFMKELEAQERAKKAKEQRLIAEKEAAEKEAVKLREQLAALDPDHHLQKEEDTPILRPYIQRQKDEKLLNNPYFEEDYTSNLKITGLIRCIDVILQSLHHLLSPIYHVQHSEYPELARLYPLGSNTRKPFHDLLDPTSAAAIATSNFNDNKRPTSSSRGRSLSSDYSNNINNKNSSGNHNNNEEEILLQEFRPPTVPTLVPSSQPRLKSSQHNHNNNHNNQNHDLLLSTFRLTETQLTADQPRGAPKGILTSDNYTSLQRTHQYLHRSAPRQFPKHIDQILDLLERHSRASSPAHGGVRRVQAPILLNSNPNNTNNTANNTSTNHNNVSNSQNNTAAALSVPTVQKTSSSAPTTASSSMHNNVTNTTTENITPTTTSNSNNVHVGEAGMQEQILEEYRTRLLSSPSTSSTRLTMHYSKYENNHNHNHHKDGSSGAILNNTPHPSLVSSTSSNSNSSSVNGALMIVETQPHNHSNDINNKKVDNVNTQKTTKKVLLNTDIMANFGQHVLEEEGSLDSVRSHKHIDNIVPRAVSFLQDHHHHQHNSASASASSSVAMTTRGTAAVQWEDSASLAQLTEEDAFHILHNSNNNNHHNNDKNRSQSPSIRVNGVYQLMKSANHDANNVHNHNHNHTVMNNNNNHKMVPVAPIHNPIFGTHTTMRPFCSSPPSSSSSPASPHRKGTNANPKKSNNNNSEEKKVMEYLDYTRYVFQARDNNIVSAYNHLQSQQQRARTASYAAAMNLLPATTTTTTTTTNHNNNNNKNNNNSANNNASNHSRTSNNTSNTTSNTSGSNMVGAEDMQSFLRSLSPPRSAPAISSNNNNTTNKSNIGDNSVVSNNQESTTAEQYQRIAQELYDTFHPANNIPPHIDNTTNNNSNNSSAVAAAAATYQGHGTAKGMGRGNKAPPSVLTAGRRLRSASPPPSHASTTTYTRNNTTTTTNDNNLNNNSNNYNSNNHVIHGGSFASSLSLASSSAAVTTGGGGHPTSSSIQQQQQQSSSLKAQFFPALSANNGPTPTTINSNNSNQNEVNNQLKVSPRPSTTNTNYATTTTIAVNNNVVLQPHPPAKDSDKTAGDTTKSQNIHVKRPVTAEVFNGALTGARLLTHNTHNPSPRALSLVNNNHTTATNTTNNTMNNTNTTINTPNKVVKQRPPSHPTNNSSNNNNNNVNHNSSQFYAARIDRRMLVSAAATSGADTSATTTTTNTNTNTNALTNVTNNSNSNENTNNTNNNVNHVINSSSSSNGGGLEDQSLMVDIIHDVRFFPPPSQPLPPAYTNTTTTNNNTNNNTNNGTYGNSYSGNNMDMRLAGGVIGSRRPLHFNHHTSSSNNNTGNNGSSNNNSGAFANMFSDEEYDPRNANYNNTNNSNSNSNNVYNSIQDDLLSSLWVAGSKTRPSSSLKEKVTGASLFM